MVTDATFSNFLREKGDFSYLVLENHVFPPLLQVSLNKPGSGGGSEMQRYLELFHGYLREPF